MHWGGEWTQRALCDCGALESLEHILTVCDNGWRAKLWREALRVLQMAQATKGTRMIPPSYPEILALGIKPYGDTAVSRNLITLILAETAFVIWKLRNAKRIRNESITRKRAISTLHDALLRLAKHDLGMSALPELSVKTKQQKLGLYKGKWEGLVRGSTATRLCWIPNDHG